MDAVTTKVATLSFALVMVLGLMNPALSFAQQVHGTPWDMLPEEPRKQSPKLDFLHKASTVYLAGATAFDMKRTADVMNYPAVARRTDGTVLGRYPGMETGWARAFGERNTAGVVAANVGLNFGISYLSERLYRRGGRWRYVAIGLNLAKGTDNLICGIRTSRNSAALDRRIRIHSGYPGQIVWTDH